MDDLLAVLVNGSVPVVEVAGWRTRERSGTFRPVGQVAHHTAARSSSSRPHPSLRVCVEGRDGIPGPLCNGLIDWHGRLFLISDGRANDTGKGSGVVLGEVRRGIAPSGSAASRGLADDTNLNPWFWDWEVDYDGVGQSPTASQFETLIRTNVAVALAGGGLTIGHLEATRRKIDPANVSMPGIRAEIDRRIQALAAMADGTGPAVEPEHTAPAATVAHTSRHTLEGEPVMRMLVPVHLDNEGRGYTGPEEGLHVPYERALAVTGHGQAYPPRDGRYKGADAYHTDEGGMLVVSVENGEPGTVAYPLVLVADG